MCFCHCGAEDATGLRARLRVIRKIGVVIFADAFGVSYDGERGSWGERFMETLDLYIARVWGSAFCKRSRNDELSREAARLFVLLVEDSR